MSCSCRPDVGWVCDDCVGRIEHLYHRYEPDLDGADEAADRYERALWGAS